MGEFVARIELCENIASELFNLLKKRPELEGKVTFPEGRRNSSCFPLKFVLPVGGTVHPIGGISISIPADVYGNRTSDDGRPSTFEVMLLNEVPEGTNFFSGTSIRNDGYEPFGYDKQHVMTHFYNDDVNGLVKEILRLCNYISLPLSS